MLDRLRAYYSLAVYAYHESEHVRLGVFVLLAVAAFSLILYLTQKLSK